MTSNRRATPTARTGSVSRFNQFGDHPASGEAERAHFKYSGNDNDIYSVSDLAHDVKVPANVVPGRQRRKQDLPRQEQMAQVRSGVSGTSIAIAALVDWPLVILVARVLDDHPALGGEQAAVAGVARGQHAIHHIHAAGHVFGEFRRACRRPWHSAAGSAAGCPSVASTISRLSGRGSPTERPPMAKAVAPQIGQRGRTFSRRRSGYMDPLHDREERGPRGAFHDAAAVMRVRLPRPPDGALHALARHTRG